MATKLLDGFYEVVLKSLNFTADVFGGSGAQLCPPGSEAMPRAGRAERLQSESRGATGGKGSSACDNIL